MATLTLLTWAFDGLLVLSLLWLAWRALSCTDLFKAIVLFIAFGLLMALVWVRLDAPDIALAEAAIGAGLTGALLLAALAKLRRQPGSAYAFSRKSTEGPGGAAGRRLLGYGALAALLAAVGGLSYVVLSLPPTAPGLSAAVQANLHASGVTHPVTAVLLNFRGYDTLLEVVVLLLALLGVWSLGGGAVWDDVKPGAVLDTLARLLVPVLILVAAYLLWVGAHGPGGAFQAGAVLGAAGVLLLLAGWRLRAGATGWALRLMLVLGPAVFLGVALATLVLEGRLLQYPPAQAGGLILLLEGAATLSIGVTLAALFLGARPDQDEEAP